MTTRTVRGGRPWLTGAALTLPLLGIAALLPRGEGPARRAAEASSPPAHGPAAVTPPPIRDGGRTAGFVGVILSRESTDLASVIEGRLEEVPVGLGDRVRRGERIASVASASLRQELAMAEASLRSAVAEQGRDESLLADAEGRRARFASLGDLMAEADRSSAELAVKLAQAALEASRARVDRERAGVDRLTAALSGCDVRAPFDGTIAARYQDPGTILRPGQPIVRLIRAQELRVRFAVPEEESRELAVGGRVSVAVETIPELQTAIVERIAPEVDPASRMVVVEGRFERPGRLGETVSSGLACRVRPAGGARAGAGGR